MKAARTAALCRVFSMCSEKGQAIPAEPRKGFPVGGTGRLPGKPEQNAVPRKGDSMGIAQAGNWLPTPAVRRLILFVHTAVHRKGVAAFFYSTYFYFFPNYATKEYSVHKGKGLPVFWERAPPFQCWKLINQISRLEGP